MTTEPQPAPEAAPLPPTGAQAPPASATGSAPGSAPGGQVVPPQSGPEQAAPPPAAAAVPHHKIKRTRISGLWVAVGCFAVVLLLLLIFILQNGEKVDISYMGAHGHLPLGVAMLFAAVCGVLLVVLAGTARISQLRATARKHRRADARRAADAERAKAASGPP